MAIPNMVERHTLLTAHCSEKLMGDLHMTRECRRWGFSVTVEQALLQSLLDSGGVDEPDPVKWRAMRSSGLPEMG